MRGTVEGSYEVHLEKYAQESYREPAVHPTNEVAVIVSIASLYLYRLHEWNSDLFNIQIATDMVESGGRTNTTVTTVMVIFGGIARILIVLCVGVSMPPSVLRKTKHLRSGIKSPS